MNRYPRRLIEVDLPIKRISAHARREKSIRHGHISTLHIWWARRSLAPCRAVILASLWPDPAPGPDDPPCPAVFLDAARTWMTRWATRHPEKASKESFPRLKAIQDNPAILGDQPLQLRNALLDFIADFANWDNSTDKDYLETSRALVQAAHEALGGAPGTKPLVVDPFAGGGRAPDDRRLARGAHRARQRTWQHPTRGEPVQLSCLLIETYTAVVGGVPILFESKR